MQRSSVSLLSFLSMPSVPAGRLSRLPGGADFLLLPIFCMSSSLCWHEVNQATAKLVVQQVTARQAGKLEGLYKAPGDTTARKSSCLSMLLVLCFCRQRQTVCRGYRAWSSELATAAALKQLLMSGLEKLSRLGRFSAALQKLIFKRTLVGLDEHGNKYFSRLDQHPNEGQCHSVSPDAG